MSVLVLTTEPQRPASSAACRHNRLKLERPIAEKLLGGSNVNFATQAPTPPNHFSPITLFTKNQSRRAFGTSRTLGPFLGLTLKPHSSGWLARSRLSSIVVSLAFYELKWKASGFARPDGDKSAGEDEGDASIRQRGKIVQPEPEVPKLKKPSFLLCIRK